VRHKIPKIVNWIRSRKGIPDEKEEELRREIIDLIGRFGDDSFVDNLVAVLNEKALFKGKLLEPTKKAALVALAQIGSESARQALHDATSYRDGFVASTAQDILKGVASGS
jgi:hypothetical protein